MQESQVRFMPLAAKTVVCHTITYFFMGILAYHFLHYEEFINRSCSGIKPTSSLWVILGAPLQVFRGVLFAGILYPLREQLFGRKNGWLLMWWLLVGLGILGSFSAADGSLEGFIFSTIPVHLQLRGYLEVVPQALLLSVLLCYWVNHTGKRWLNWVLPILYVLCAGLPLMALVAPRR